MYSFVLNRLGSVEVDYTIKYGTKDFTVASNLTKAVLDLGNRPKVSFNGQNVSVFSGMILFFLTCYLYGRYVPRQLNIVSYCFLSKAAIKFVKQCSLRIPDLQKYGNLKYTDNSMVQMVLF